MIRHLMERLNQFFKSQFNQSKPWNGDQDADFKQWMFQRGLDDEPYKNVLEEPGKTRKRNKSILT